MQIASLSPGTRFPYTSRFCVKEATTKNTFDWQGTLEWKYFAELGLNSALEWKNTVEHRQRFRITEDIRIVECFRITETLYKKELVVRIAQHF